MLAAQHYILSSAWGDAPTKRYAGGLLVGSIPIRLINPAKDGYVSVSFFFGSAIGPFTQRLMDVLFERGYCDEVTRGKDWIGYIPLLVSGEEPVSELARVIELVSSFTANYTKAELFELAREKDLLIAPIVTIDELLSSEQLSARGFWQEVEHPELGRKITHPGPFSCLEGTPIQFRRRPPLLGEHNDEIIPGEQSDAPAPSLPASRALPLEGVKVLDLMWVVAGPEATRYLADYGATVVKIESTTLVDTSRTLQPFKDGVPGPERSGLFACTAAGKLGVTLDLKSDAGREVFFKLVQWADVLTESFASGAMKAMGFDYEHLREINPGLIMMSSCLNGQTGPQSSVVGFGTMGAQFAGFGEIVGWPDRPPAAPFGAYTDYVVPKFEVAALLAALDHRRRTGEGQYIDFSQAEGSIGFLAPAVLDYTVNGRVLSRLGNASLHFAPHGVFPVVGEDRWVAIATETEEQWESLAAAAGRREWLSDPRFSTLEERLKNSSALEDEISAWTNGMEAEVIENLLVPVGVPVHRASVSEDLIGDLQLNHRGHWATVEHPELGEVLIEGSRMVFSATPASNDRPGPTFGQHNEYVLTHLLGLSDEEVAVIASSGALQ